MNVHELLKLKRPLTEQETAFMEQEALRLAQALQDEVQKLTKDLDPNDPEVAKLRASPQNIIDSLELASAAREQESGHETARMQWSERARKRSTEPIYDWEKLPVYEWSNEFARVIGRLLATLPKRLHIYAHNLAGQATLISNCIAMGHRQTAPGETAPPDELRAYRFIGYHATFTAMEMLEDLSRETKFSAAEVAHGMSLIGRIRQQFEIDLEEIETPEKPPVVLH